MQTPGQGQPLRYVLIGAGWLCVALGVAGILLPLLPTTPFLLLAAACFSRASPRFDAWLTDHTVLGPYIRDWRRNHTIPRRAKILSVMMMIASLAWLALFSRAPAVAVWITGAVLLAVAGWIVTRPEPDGT